MLHLRHKYWLRSVLRNCDYVSDLIRSFHCHLLSAYVWQSWGMLHLSHDQCRHKLAAAAAQVCFLFVWRGSSFFFFFWVWSVYRILKIPLCCISIDAGPVVSFCLHGLFRCWQPGCPHGKEQPEDAKDFQLCYTGRRWLQNRQSVERFKLRVIKIQKKSPLDSKNPFTCKLTFKGHVRHDPHTSYHQRATVGALVISQCCSSNQSRKATEYIY